MIEAGLLIAGEDIPVSYDRFRDRIMFPITDFRGRVIAFGGRALAADAQAKYLNSPETPLFHKSHVLYNGQAARAASRKGGHVIVVEGYIDVIACVAAGFEATVAPLGTALTEDQLRMLWQMADEPILCFDGDEAGLKAAFRAVDLALPQLKPGQEPALRAAARRAGPRRSHPQRRAGGVPQGARRGEAAGRHALAQRGATALDLAHAGAARRARADACAQRSRRSAIPMSAGTTRSAVRERVERQFGAAARPAEIAARRRAVRDRCARRGFDAEPTGPSASLLANPLVRGQRAGQPGRASARPCSSASSSCIRRSPPSGWRSLADAHFAGKGSSALGGAHCRDARRNHLRFRPPSCGPRSERAGHGGAGRGDPGEAAQVRPRRAGGGRCGAGRGGLGRRCPLASAGGSVIYRAAGSRDSARSRDERGAI